MKAKTLLVLFLVTAALFTYVYFAIEKPAKDKEISGDKENRLAIGKLDAVQSFRITTENKSLELKRETIGWRLIAPAKDLASQSKVENLISSLEKFRKTRTLITPEKLKSETINLSQYGLNPPKLTIEYRTSDLSEPVLLEIGGANPSGNATYAKTAKEGVVMATQDLDSFATQSFEDFREMRLTTVSSSDFEEVEINYLGKKSKFKREKDLWTMTEPYTLPLDQDFTKSIMDKISFVRANKFLTTPVPALTKPDTRILVGFKKDVKDLRTSESDSRPEGFELLLSRSKLSQKKGQENFDYFAKSDKTLPASVAQFHYDNFTKPPEDFIKKTFNDFLNADVQKMTIRHAKKPELILTKTDKGFSSNQGFDVPEENAKKILDKLRELRANKFLALSKAPNITELSVKLEMKDKKPTTFGFDFQKDSTLLWFAQGDQVLKYALPKDAIAAKEFETDSLKAPREPKATTQALPETKQ